MVDKHLTLINKYTNLQCLWKMKRKRRKINIIQWKRLRMETKFKTKVNLRLINKINDLCKSGYHAYGKISNPSHLSHWHWSCNHHSPSVLFFFFGTNTTWESHFIEFLVSPTFTARDGVGKFRKRGRTKLNFFNAKKYF